MAGIRIKDLPFESDPSSVDLIAIHDESTGTEKKIAIGAISAAVESEVIDRVVKVRVEDEGVSLNPTGSSTLNFIGPGVTATAAQGDPNIANVTIRDKVVSNLLYVTEDGDDQNDGLTLDNSKASIRSALREAGGFYEYADLSPAPSYPNLGSLQSNTLGEVKRYFNLLKDAGNTIALNKNFIIEEAWGYSVGVSANPNFNNFPEKGKRDLGYVLDSIVADIKNGGNLSTVSAGKAFFNKAGVLDYIDLIVSETKESFSYLKSLMVASMRNWEFQGRVNTTNGNSEITILTELGSLGFLEGMVVSGSGIPLGTTIASITGSNTVTLSGPPTLTQSNITLTFTMPASGKYNLAESTGLSTITDPSLTPDTDHFLNGESECSGVAHAIENYFTLLEFILDNGADSVSPTLPPEGITIFVKAGSYQEDNPLEVPCHSSIIGDNLRITTVFPLNLDKDLFQVNNGSYLAGMSFRSVGNADFPNAVVAFPSSGAGQIYESPYVQNCTNFIPESTGLKVEGDRALGLKSMVLDAFTQYNPGGVGCHVLDQGYTQLVSMFTICSDKSVLTETGGYASLTNSNSDFGNFGLFSVGLSPLVSEYTAFGNYDSNSFVFLLRGENIENFPPYLGLVAEPVEGYYVVSEVVIDNPGEGYSEEPTISFNPPLGRNGINAEAGTVITSGVVTEINLVSEGGQYTLAQTLEQPDTRYNETRRILDPSLVTISGGSPTTPLEVTVYVEPVYYTVKKVNKIDGLDPATYRVEFEENVPFEVNDGEIFEFYQPSTIVSSAHTFEYIGGGTDILTALPQSGAEFLPENEAVYLNGGRIATTSSDQGGNFRIGDGIFINNARGQIEGEDFERSLFNIMSPFIIALGD